MKYYECNELDFIRPRPLCIMFMFCEIITTRITLDIPVILNVGLLSMRKSVQSLRWCIMKHMQILWLLESVSKDLSNMVVLGVVLRSESKQLRGRGIRLVTRYIAQSQHNVNYV